MMEIEEDFSYLDKAIIEHLSIDDEKYNDISRQLGLDVQCHKISILEVVEKLGCLLLNSSFSSRDVGVSLLCDSLKSLQRDSLSQEQLIVVSSYFCEKLKDHHQVATTSLRGVKELLNFTDIPNDSLVLLLSCIFNHITCQQQQQPDRYMIYEIFEAALAKQPTVIVSMGIDFVYGVISSIEGERDPKNLYFLFNWLPIFLKSVKLAHLTEEMFDVLSCYFPVDFKAPPSGKNNITREDLASSLGQCLTCIPEFGEFGIPLAMEKLEAALKIAKLDSLEILRLGCQSYETETYYKHSIEIWSTLQKEIFNNPEMRQECLHTLQSVISKLSETDQTKFENTILDIADTLRANALPDAKFFEPSSQMLLYVADASAISSLIVAKKVEPLLENAFKITENHIHRAKILNLFVNFSVLLLKNNSDKQFDSVEEIASCPALCAKAILDPSEEVNIEGFEGFAKIARYISRNVLHTYLESLQKSVIFSMNDNVRAAVLRSIRTFAEQYPDEVAKYFLYRNVLTNLCSLDNYLQCLNSMATSEAKHHDVYIAETYMTYSVMNIECSSVALNNLSKLIDTSESIFKLLLKQDFVMKLIKFLVTLDSTELRPKEFLNGIQNTLLNIFRKLDADDQSKLLTSVLSEEFKNSDIHAMVLSGIMKPLRAGVFQDYDKLDFLVVCAMHSKEEYVRDKCMETMATIVNKIGADNVLNDKLHNIKTRISDDVDIDTKLWITSWITKGLVTRNHPQAWQWTDMLIDNLHHSIQAAKGFKIVIESTSEVLSMQNNCQIMPLFKQKFFVYCAKKFIELEKENIASYSALGYLIEEAPDVALLGQLKKILRLILLSLEKSVDATALSLIIRKITAFTAKAESEIEDHLEDILNRILKLTRFEDSMTVRIDAIKFLYQVAVSFKTYQLLPFKQKVIHQLALCVDDRKRLVRREAMECRSLWYLLDAPL